MSRIGHLCHSGVSRRGFTPRIEVVRRTLIVSSALVAALSVAWSATSVYAGAIIPTALAATTQHAQSHHTARTQSHASAAVTAGSSPTLLQSQSGTSEASAISAAGSGNPQVETPADPSIAVGPNNVVEAVNSALEVTTRTGASPVYMNISAMIDNTSGFYLEYPHVMYDPASGLFILMVLQFNKTLSSCVSQVAVMVSQANPALPWNTRGTINIDPALITSGVELSNVSLGMSAGVVVESSDYESCSTGLPVASQTVIIRRADLVSGANTANTFAFVEPGPLGVQPAAALSATSVEYEVANDANCNVIGNDPGNVAIFAIDGLPIDGAITVVCTSATVTPATSVPPPAPQEGTAATLTTGNDRFLSAVWQGNVLWATGNTGCTPSGDSQVRSCVNVDTIAASSAGSIGAFTELPVEGVNGSYLYDPALALDNAGDAVLTFDKSSGSAFESMMVAAITGGTWSSLITLRTSTTFYSPSSCTSCHWGDYSAAVQDVSHPTDVWVLSEETDGNTGTACATANTCWNTYIGRYTFAGPVISSLSPAAGPASGGELVTVNGSDFAPGSTFTFNGATVLPTAGSFTPDTFTFTTPAGSSGLVQAQVSDSIGTSPITVGSGYIYVGLANYVPAPSPFRILDTRSGSCIQCLSDPTFGAGSIEKLQLTNVAGLAIGTDPIPSYATAVVLNVTEVAGTASSLLTVYPYGTGLPKASNLNFAAGKVIANLVTVTMGQGGAVDIYNALGTVNVLADVEGWFVPNANAPCAVCGEFHPIAPVRVCDTRSTSNTLTCKEHGEIGPGGALLVNVTGTGADAIPGDGTAAAVVVNVTGVAGSAGTFLSLSPTNSSGQCPYSGTHAPSFSTINLTAGLVAANRVMIALGPSSPGGNDNSLCVYNALGSINVVIDAGGWFGGTTAAAGAQYQAIQPTRICDTRVGSAACAAHVIAAGTPAQVVVAGQGSVPAGTTAVAIIANLTAIAPTAATYVVVYPANVVHPLASDINLSAGEVLPNLVVVQIDTVAGAGEGDVDIYNGAGNVNAIVDIEGWFQ
jgi:IPT/TIG domain-containing protein